MYIIFFLFNISVVTFFYRSVGERQPKEFLGTLLLYIFMNEREKKRTSSCRPDYG